MQKSPRMAEISTKVVGGYCFMFTLYVHCVITIIPLSLDNVCLSLLLTVTFLRVNLILKSRSSFCLKRAINPIRLSLALHSIFSEVQGPECVPGERKDGIIVSYQGERLLGVLSALCLVYLVTSLHMPFYGVFISTYTVSQKGSVTLIAVTLSNLKGFSKFFHRRILQEICTKVVIKDPTTP